MIDFIVYKKSKIDSIIKSLQDAGYYYLANTVEYHFSEEASLLCAKHFSFSVENGYSKIPVWSIESSLVGYILEEDYERFCLILSLSQGKIDLKKVKDKVEKITNMGKEHLIRRLIQCLKKKL